MIYTIDEKNIELSFNSKEIWIFKAIRFNRVCFSAMDFMIRQKKFLPKTQFII